MSTPGKLFVFEGPNGVGKTTLAHALVKHLLATGVPCNYHSFPGSEEKTLGRSVYELHHQACAGVISINPTSLQLLHVAAHIDAIEARIRPALSGGKCVVLDRFWWSTWVYGIVNGANPRTLAAIIETERVHWDGIAPKAIFHISRTEPIDERPTPFWLQLSNAYDKLSQQETSKYAVHHILNESTVSDAIAHVVQFLI